jgi:hypothetical protein
MEGRLGIDIEVCVRGKRKEEKKKKKDREK